MKNEILLSEEQKITLLSILKARFEANMYRHKDLKWDYFQNRLEANPKLLYSLFLMEDTGGEPDVICFQSNPNEFFYCDCSAESPKGRRSLCYDPTALESRKENKPHNSVLGMAEEMGVEVLNEEQYHDLQKTGTFDAKTSSWLITPPEVRQKGGAIFGDWRYGRVFVYHNGAESYYASRGFRAFVRI